jgi:serine/threonine protein phosphatase 1
MKGLTDLFRLRKSAARERRARLRLAMEQTAVYAVGDVHGCLDLLLDLEQVIAADAADLPGGKVIVMLGDYVDRGPASAQVIDHLLAPAPAGFERICLAGNHEVLMLDYLDGRIGLGEWMTMGAAATLTSYGVDHDRLGQVYGSTRQVDELIRGAIPTAHVTFLRSLPILVEAPRHIFVHAGIRPDVEMDRQSDEDLVFIRNEFYDRAHLLKKYVVHGHTPVAEATRQGPRVNIDTGAYYSGRLTALRIWQNRGVYLTSRDS